MTPQNNKQTIDHINFPEKPKTILVADDELLVAQGIVSSLTTLGFTTDGPYKNGQDAVDRCRDARPDLALLDIQMPIMDGIAAAQIIFRDFDIPVVMLTAYSDETYLHNSSEAGVFGYLLKPSSTEQLSAGITVAWSRYLDHVKQRGEIVDLQQRLDDRKLIERAKWIIVQRKSISEPEAMKMLQKQSRSSRKSIADVARAVIDSDGLL